MQACRKLTVGATMVDGKTTAPNEILGKSITGGVRKPMAVGDVFHIISAHAKTDLTERNQLQVVIRQQTILCEGEVGDPRSVRVFRRALGEGPGQVLQCFVFLLRQQKRRGRVLRIDIHQPMRFQVRKTALARDYGHGTGDVMLVDVALHRFVDTLQPLGGEPGLFRFDGLDRSRRQRQRDQREDQ
jgi:hypothetical protein